MRREEKGSLTTLTYAAWFSLMALVVKIVTTLPENPGDWSSIQNLFLQSKNKFWM
ncbi:hypothetical protein [Nostoc sp.]